ncbi:hypothetical protein UFO1_1648 [Pelosinus sp. UFO1]|nr:hypothetical protein UFO1_1648 [Pelosinus sp. UFO1]
MAGMSSSDIIIAINKDADAPIFKLDNYGIVGDVIEIIPFLIEAFSSVKINMSVFNKNNSFNVTK